MKKLLLLCFFYTGFLLQAQVLVSHQLIDTRPAANLNIIAGGLAKYDVETYKVTYNTVNIDGTPTVASGAVCIPIQRDCDTLSLIAYCHGTVLEKNDVPSANNFESIIGKIFSSTGYVVAMPDYLGLGDNGGLHPYVHAQSEATATVDVMRAARELAVALGGSLHLQNEVMLTGYSQGGHAAMATAKYIQDSSLLGEFNVLAAAPASGPYDLAGSQSEVFIQNAPYSNPGYVVYLLMGMNRVYGNIYSDISHILKAPYDTLIPPYFDGTYPMDSVNSKLPNLISGFMVDTVLQNFVADTVNKAHPIWQALLKSTNYNWNPQFPVRMFYCTSDEQVSFENSLRAAAAMRSFGANAAAINKGNFSHGGCVFPSIQGASKVIDSVSSSCKRTAMTISVSENTAENGFEVFPNPAQNEVYFKGPLNTGTARLILLNGAGQKIVSKTYEGSLRLDVSGLKRGMYIGVIMQGRKQHICRIVLQ